jgi:hypothetical protein
MPGRSPPRFERHRLGYRIIQPFKASLTALTRQSTVTFPFPLQLKAGHWSRVKLPSAILTPFTHSSTVTLLSLVHSPMQDAGNVGPCVAVGVAVVHQHAGLLSRPAQRRTFAS